MIPNDACFPSCAALGFDLDTRGLRGDSASAAGRAPEPVLVCWSVASLDTVRKNVNGPQRDGDGDIWSSFALRIGTPAQDVRVLVSTNSPVVMAVAPEGCTTQAVKPVPVDCANSRGQLFNSSQSSTWIDQGFFGINSDGIGFEANLGYSVNADYGLETVGLGFSGGADDITLENQTVARIATVSPFYTYASSVCSI